MSNVTGVQRTDFYQAPIPIGQPTWPSINPTPASVNGSATLTANPTEGSALSRYLLTAISISGSQTLTITGNPDRATEPLFQYIKNKYPGTITISQAFREPTCFDTRLNLQSGNAKRQ